MGTEEIAIAEREFHDRLYQKRQSKPSICWCTIETVLFGDILRDTDRKLILEIGCGDGTGIRDLAKTCEMKNIDYVGIDISAVAIEQAAHNYPYGVFDVHDCHKLWLRDNVLDLVLSFGVLHHVAEPFTALDECMRVLKPGGRLLALEASEMMRKGESPHERGISVFEFTQHVNWNGHTIERLVRFNPRITEPLRWFCWLARREIQPWLYRQKTRLDLALDSRLGRYGIMTGKDFGVVVRKKDE
jgi:SAM-dependent methyltransferase